MAHETSDLGEWARLASRVWITSRAATVTLHPSQVHAWEIADQLLRLKRDVPTSTFAAHTMRGKVRRGGHHSRKQLDFSPANLGDIPFRCSLSALARQEWTVCHLAKG